jgi:RNA polymerase sigma factor (TIGR02999 family)
MSEVVRILAAVEHGDTPAAEQLLPLIYDELRRLAAHHLARENPGDSLQATALVHEAYLRLAGAAHSPSWDGRRHFFAAAAEAMRRILIDRARARLADKRGGDRRRVPLADTAATAEPPADELLALDEALARFAADEPDKAELVKLRYFAGLPEEEAAAALGISRATASRWWAYSRAWLIHALDGPSE